MPQDSHRDTTEASMAATKIQANFRGYRVRKRFKESQKDANSQSPMDQGQRDEYPRGKGESPVPEKENVERVSLEEKSATKIQAGVRGFLVRKRQEVARVAATRIQAGFRGFKTRKLLKESGQ
ncbi:uncharacterized protein LOC116423821 [Nomia melanderi]|uniref:uncharacterized protein LOC116423821 n=1 Tax=Nomia melanderi TaxID=2448451 RepID=UPI001303FCFD|nr:neuromodulin-like [Nomia melanderi]